MTENQISESKAQALLLGVLEQVALIETKNIEKKKELMSLIWHIKLELTNLISE